MNSDNNKKQISKQNITDCLASLVAKINLKYNIPIQEFFDSYKKQLINVGKKQNPDYSMVELSARTGIDRRYIKQHLNDEISKAKPSKIKSILIQLKELSKITNSTFVKKQGKSKSFESICNIVAPGSLTASSIAKELIRRGNIVEKQNGYEVIEFNYTPGEENHGEHIKLLIVEMDRISDTILHNVETKNVDQKQYQRNIFSTQINPSNFYHAKKEIVPILINSRIEIDNIIVKYEEDVPVGEYPDFGASMFVFGFDKRNDSFE